MKTYGVVGALISAIFFIVLSSCSGSGSSNTGTLSLNLSDAALVDEANVTGVYITVTDIQYHAAGGGWQSMEEFNTSINPINLLEWQEGQTISLGDFQMPSGKYTQLRFMLDATEEGTVPKSNPGCMIEFNGDNNETLYVPSGSQTGYKAIGNYEVPINGAVTMTADFDVRKSIVVSGDGSYYKLKPTIRLVVTDEAGTISGNVTNMESNASYVIYAYEYDADGNTTWSVSETDDPNPSDPADVRFGNALNSNLVKEDGSYKLPFLAAGNYDLIIAKYDGNGDYITFYIHEGVVVESGETTLFDWVL